MSVTGTDKVIKKLNARIKKIEGDIAGGLMLGCLDIRRDSQIECPVVEGNLKNSAYIVMESKHRRDSEGTMASFTGKQAPKMSSQHSTETREQASIVKRESKSGPVAAIGYTAVYAVPVHENPRTGKTGGLSPKGVPYNPPLTGSGKAGTRKAFSTVGKYKFLEDPLKNNTRKLMNTLRRKAKIR